MDRGKKESCDEPKEFGFMAGWSVRQWICHSPTAMKTDIFGRREARGSGKSTQGSIRFDSLWLAAGSEIRRRLASFWKLLVSLVDGHPAPEVNVSSGAGEA